MDPEGVPHRLTATRSTEVQQKGKLGGKTGAIKGGSEQIGIGIKACCGNKRRMDELCVVNQ